MNISGNFNTEEREVQIVKENCSTDFDDITPQNDMMERLLRSRKGL